LTTLPIPYITNTTGMPQLKIGVYELDCEDLKMRRPWLTRDWCTMEKV